MSVGGVHRLGLAIIAFAATAAMVVPTHAQTEAIDYRRQWFIETGVVRRETLRTCAVFRGHGIRLGQLAFQSMAPNCANYYVHAAEIAASLEDVRVFLPLPELGIEQACHQAGWLYGFVQAHQSLWPVCEAELDEARRHALATRIDACRAVGEVVKADSQSLVDFLRNHVDRHDDDTLALLRQKMVALVYLGRSREAWQALLTSERNADFSSLPCQVAIALALTEEN